MDSSQLEDLYVQDPLPSFNSGEEAPTNFPTDPDANFPTGPDASFPTGPDANFPTGPEEYSRDPQEYIIRTCDENSFHFEKNSFHFDSDRELSHHKSNRVLQCFTCSNYKSSFYCYSCIRHGDFCSGKSSREIEERFAEKKLKYYLNLQVKSNHLSDISNLLERKIQVDTLESEINRRRRNISRLKSFLDQKKRNIERMREKGMELRRGIEKEERLSKELKEAKIEFTKKCIAKIGARTKQKEMVNQGSLNGIKELTWDLSYQLQSSIFTLDIFNPEETDATLTNSEESLPLLGCHSGSGFDHIASNNETKYTVVEPWIPASVDIMPYVMWVTRHKDEMASSESLGMRNDAFRTSAALANLCQMTQVLAGILDLCLPRRLSFHEFFSKPGQDVDFLTEEELRNKVAKLNANVSYLCLSQKLDPDLINVRQPVKNIINLLNPSLQSDLGRRGFVQIDPDFLRLLESVLSTDLQLVEETVPCYYSSQDCDQDLEMDFDMIPNWPTGAEALPSPSEINLTGSYLPSPGILTSVFSRMFTRE